MKMHNEDGLVEHRGPRRKTLKAWEKTPATVLEEALERADVRSAVAVWFGLPPVASIGEVVKTAIDREILRETISYARKLAAAPTVAPTLAFPAFVATCAAFVLWASGQVPQVPSEAQAAGLRHLAHHAMAAGSDEPSPIRLKPTAAELRHWDSVRRWWE